MIDTRKEYIEKTKQLISQLRDVQSALDPDLSNVKVRINEEQNGMLAKSIETIFGDRSESPDKDFITFDMYMHCVRIMRAAGKAKAQEVYGKHLVV